VRNSTGVARLLAVPFGSRSCGRGCVVRGSASTWGLSRACARNDALRRICRPEVEALHVEGKETGSIVILTDAAGLILEALGSAEFGTRASRVALRPGVQWSESSTGTNAIGAAIAERRPVEVRGAEHYFISTSTTF
jgi:transcriptional regulator of acetoin/glycerol metabolism